MDLKKSGTSGKRPAESAVAGPCIKLLKIKKNENNSGTALHEAIRQNNKILVEELLKAKWNININATDNAGDTALHVAASKDFDDLIHLLLRNQATSDIKNKSGNTFLDVIRNVAIRKERKLQKFKNHKGNYCIKIKKKDNKAVILSKTCDSSKDQLFLGSEDNTKSLHEAAKRNQLVLVRKLIKQNAPVDATDKNNRTPLHCAALYGCKEVALELLHNGANINALDKDNWTPLHCAAHLDNTDVVQLLIQNGAQMNTANNKHLTPLHIAVENGCKM